MTSMHILLRDDLKTKPPVDRRFHVVSIVTNNANHPEPSPNRRLRFEVAPKRSFRLVYMYDGGGCHVDMVYVRVPAFWVAFLQILV